MKWNMGNIAFMVGFFGSILLGLLGAFGVFEMGMIFSTILIVAGIIIGLMNIGKGEKVPLMVASLTIGAGAGVLSTLEFVGSYFSAILEAMALVIVPAGIVVAVMVFMNKAK